MVPLFSSLPLFGTRERKTNSDPETQRVDEIKRQTLPSDVSDSA